MKNFERLTDKNDLYWALQETKLSAEAGIYLTDCLNRLFEYENKIEKAEKIAVVIFNNDGTTECGYYNMSLVDKALARHEIEIDIIDGVVQANKDRYKD